MASGIISFTLKVIISVVVAVAMQVGMAMSALHSIDTETIAESAEGRIDSVPFGLAGSVAPTPISWDGVPAEEVGWRDALVKAAESQLGVGYWSLHYGPAGDPYGNGEGFGCAMFVSYSYNNVFFGGARADEPGDGPLYTDGCAGWTQAYWGNAMDDSRWGLNPGFHEVSADEVLPGDVVCFLDYADAYDAADFCYHVGMYCGRGRVIDSTDSHGVAIRNIDLSDPTLHYMSFSGSDVANRWQASHQG